MKFVEKFTPVQEELKCHVEVENGTVRVFAQHRDGSEWCIFRMRRMSDGTLSATVGSVDNEPVMIRRNGAVPKEMFRLCYNLMDVARDWEVYEE